MAIEVNLRKPAPPEVVVDAVPLPRSARIDLALRRRRLRRLQHNLVTAAWITGAVVLAFFVALGVLSPH